MSHLESSDQFDLARIGAHPWLNDFLYLPETESTNNVALARGAEGQAATPLLVLAARQSQGRGRGSNRWWASDGALTFSLLVDSHQLAVPLSDLPCVPLLTGLAVARALQALLPADLVQLKWPNDIFLRQRKLGGILVESSSGPQPRLVIGIGLNVNNSLASAPADVSSRATSLIDAFRARFALTDVLTGLLSHLSQIFSDTDVPTVELLREWRKLCMLTGRHVELATGHRHISGRCEGIDDHGALCIETEEGLERCYAGVIVKIT